MNTDEFFASPYGDRQLITFIDDSEVEKPTKKAVDRHPAAQTAASMATAVGVAGLGGTIASGLAVGGVLATGGLLVLPLAAIAAGFGLRRFFRSDRSEPPAGIVLIRKSWSPTFVLPPGHPRNRVVFAGHPAEPRTYIPLADFHRYTFEHKFSEILSILMHLGATKIEVKHVRGWGQDFSEKLSIGIPRVEVSQQTGVSQRERSSILYEAEL